MKTENIIINMIMSACCAVFAILALLYVLEGDWKNATDNLCFLVHFATGFMFMRWESVRMKLAKPAKALLMMMFGAFCGAIALLAMAGAFDGKWLSFALYALATTMQACAFVSMWRDMWRHARC